MAWFENFRLTLQGPPIEQYLISAVTLLHDAIVVNFSKKEARTQTWKIRSKIRKRMVSYVSRYARYITVSVY